MRVGNRLPVMNFWQFDKMTPDVCKCVHQPNRSKSTESLVFQNFMNPMFAKMEESVKKNNEMLEQIQR